MTEMNEIAGEFTLVQASCLNIVSKQYVAAFPSIDDFPAQLSYCGNTIYFRMFKLGSSAEELAEAPYSSVRNIACPLCKNFIC